MKKFNTRRRLKGYILSAVASSKWIRPIVNLKFGLERTKRRRVGDESNNGEAGNDEENEEAECGNDDDEGQDDDEYLSEQTRNKLFLEDQTSSQGQLETI